VFSPYLDGCVASCGADETSGSEGDAWEPTPGFAEGLFAAVRFFRSQQRASPFGHGSDFSEGNFGFTDLRLPWTVAGSEPGPGFTDGAGLDAGADGPDGGLFEEKLFEEKNDPLSPGPECSHLGIAYSAPARSAMTPSATRILSVTVLTPRVCVSPPDIFFAVNAHKPVLLALPVISNHTRRKNAKQRAGKSLICFWMRKNGLPEKKTRTFVQTA
jgi:hypothetical protein